MSFVAAAGGERRAPRRAAAKYSSYPTSTTVNAPSVKDHEHSFDTKVAFSRKSGVWGGAEEIQAFCQSFMLDVNVYTVYGVQHFRDVNASEDEDRGAVHIAFHVGQCQWTRIPARILITASGIQSLFLGSP